MPAFSLQFHPAFISELDSAIEYYNDQSENAAIKFKVETRKQLSLIKKNPLTRSIRYDDVRFARIGKFPYAIHYSTDIENKSVLVHALLSDHQDPNVNWKKRF